jgi:NAD(P)-dependent dehydrogenase (short-subunit alcohol dehydrogenase family)
MSGLEGEVAHRFADRVAVVTGGGSGLGQATAIRLSAEGAYVAVLDIRLEDHRGGRSSPSLGG